MNQPPQAHVVTPANDYIAALTTMRELVASLGAIERAASEGQPCPALVTSTRKLLDMVARRLQEAPTHHAWIEGGRVTTLHPRPKENAQ